MHGYSIAMTRFGYTLMTEQSGPRDLVGFAVAAEQVGFDFEVCSDHYSPWLAAQGHRVRRHATGVLPEGRVIGQVPVCWDPDRDRAVKRAHEQFRWFAGGWSVNADLPTPAGFAAATQFVRPEDVAAAIPCGPDLDGIIESVDEYRQAGFTDIALVQIGGESQEQFLSEAAKPLLAALRAALD